MTISTLHVTATDLETWSQRRNAQDQLPRLLRDLIFGLEPSPNSIAMVSGEGVQRGGWDGVIDSDGADPFVPAGISGWEISVRKDVVRKADDDYQKRVDKPLGLDPSETTFVFSTSRVFPEKEAWVAQKLAEGVWRDLKVIDADDLEAWLEKVPAVHLRISEDLGKKPPGVTDLVTASIELASSTAPPLSNALIIAGRNETVAKIQEALVGAQDVIAIAADSREEALALFSASLEELEEPDRSSLTARSVVVWDSSHWGGLVAREESLVLIPMFENRSKTGAATRNGHRVVVPLGREEGRQSDVAVEVGRPRRDSLREELERLGVPRHRAAELAGIGRRSFLSLKRQIAKAPDVEQPAWAQPDNAADVLPAFFGGAWVDGNIKDREALENLSNRPYDDWSRVMRRWANDSDPPLRQVGDVWLLASKEDAWPLLRAAIRPQDLDALRNVCLEVFGWIDTRHDLPPDKQWSVGLFKDEPETSATLRGGLADTLALLGARSGDFPLPDGSGQDHASRIVREILAGADEDWRAWATLGRVLPLFAEAAPDEFLTSVERGTRGGDTILAKLFVDYGSSMWGFSPHTELLWALERLAWSSTHLPRAALALARLARLDPGGKTTSRPSDSLRRIFLVFRPHTAADIQTRRLVLETIIEREPEVGWKLLVDLMPDHHSWWTSTSRPEHRDWAPDDDAPRTWQEIFSDLESVVDLALANCGVDGARWAGLVGKVDRLRPEAFDRVVGALEGLDPGTLEAEGLTSLRDALRDLIARHRSFPDADWAMPEESAERLETVYNRLEPADAIERHRWIFSEGPALMDLESRDWETKQDALHERRVAVAREVYADQGLEGLFALAAGADRALDLGSTLGREGIISAADALELLHRGLDADDEMADVARGFAWATSRQKGAGWLREVIDSEGERWTEQQMADFLLASSYHHETWELVEEAGGEVPRLYWSRASVLVFPEYELAEAAAQKLLQHGRPYSAIRVLDFALHNEEEPTSWDVVVSALEEAPGTDPAADPTGSLSYHVERLLNRVTKSEEISDDRLAQLEWSWLPLLDSTQRSAAVLHRELGRSPGFFAALVALVYKAEGEGEEEVETSEDAATKAQQGVRLLESWRSLPGTQEDGTLSGDDLGAWVEGALEATRESRRTEIGEFVIGQVLSRSPTGQDGQWPHEAVRAVIEQLESEPLERGFQNGHYNSRGVTTRGPFDGGAQERALSDSYQAHAEAVNARAPRTAAMLGRIAETYKREAEREDRSAELLEDLEG